MRRFLIIVFLMMFVLANFTSTVRAEEQIEIEWITGPQKVDIGSKLATLDLPENYIFASGEDAKKIMEYFGNPITDQEVGIIFPESEDEDWYILFEYDPIGFIKDDDASDLDADEILNSIIEGTKEANKERNKEGIPSLEVIGWDEKPHYDADTNNLVWSIIAESEGEKISNHNTRILGRYGVMVVTLVADPEQLSTIKPELIKILGNFSYIEGSKYSDFIPEKDKVAEFGLTALIAGGVGAAASKAGLLAKILLLFKKFWIFLLVIIGGLFKKIKDKFYGEDEQT